MATQPTNTSDIVFLQLKWDFKLIDVYTRLGKSKSSSIIISKDKKSKNSPKVYKEFSYIPIHSEDPFMKLDSKQTTICMSLFQMKFHDISTLIATSKKTMTYFLCMTIQKLSSSLQVEYSTSCNTFLLILHFKTTTHIICFQHSQLKMMSISKVVILYFRPIFKT